MSIKNSLIKLAWENPLQRRALLEVVAELSKEAEKINIRGLDTFNTNVPSFKLTKHKDDWEAERAGNNNNSLFKILSIIDLNLLNISKGAEIKNIQQLTLFRDYKNAKTSLNKEDSGDHSKWMKLMGVYGQLIDYIEDIKGKSKDKTYSDEAKAEDKKNAEELHAAFGKHIRALGARLHNDPELEKEE